MTTSTEAQAVNLAVRTADEAYAAYIRKAAEFVAEYMNSIGVKNHSIDRWQPVVWYDGLVRIIPYKILLEGKDKFIYELHGAGTPCYEYMFMRLDCNGITYKAIKL